MNIFHVYTNVDEDEDEDNKQNEKEKEIVREKGYRKADKVVAKTAPPPMWGKKKGKTAHRYVFHDLNTHDK